MKKSNADGREPMSVERADELTGGALVEAIDSEQRLTNHVSSLQSALSPEAFALFFNMTPEDHEAVLTRSYLDLSDEVEPEDRRVADLYARWFLDGGDLQVLADENGIGIEALQAHIDLMPELVADYFNKRGHVLAMFSVRNEVEIVYPVEKPPIESATDQVAPDNTIDFPVPPADDPQELPGDDEAQDATIHQFPPVGEYGDAYIADLLTQIGDGTARPHDIVDLDDHPVGDESQGSETSDVAAESSEAGDEEPEQKSAAELPESHTMEDGGVDVGMPFIDTFDREFDFFTAAEFMDKKSKIWSVEADKMFAALAEGGHMTPEAAKALSEHIKDEKARPRSKAVDHAFDDLKRQRTEIGGLKPSDRYPNGLNLKMDRITVSFLEGSKKPSVGYVENLLQRLAKEKATEDYDIRQTRCLAVAIIRELYADKLQV